MKTNKEPKSYRDLQIEKYKKIILLETKQAFKLYKVRNTKKNRHLLFEIMLAYGEVFPIDAMDKFMRKLSDNKFNDKFDNWLKT